MGGQSTPWRQSKGKNPGIVERGKHAALLAAGGLYARLALEQADEEGDEARA